MYCQTSSSVQLREREDAQVLALADARVVEVPRLRPLAARVPAAEVVAQREHALLGARALLVAAGAAEAARRSGAPRSRRAASPSAAGCATRAGRSPRDAAGVDRLLDRGDDQRARPARRRGGRGTRAPRGSCGRCRRAAAGTGAAPGANAFSASRSSTIESLPPLNSSAGRSRSAATSRMMWMASASSARRGGLSDAASMWRSRVERCDQRVHHDVQPALGLVEARPAALAAGARARAVRAADRGVALVVQRVVREVALGDAAPDVRLGPVRRAG